MIRRHGFPESRQEWSNDSERAVKIQPQSTSLSDPDRVYRQQKAIPVAWNAYNGDQVFRRRRECNRTVGIKTGRIHRADSSNCSGNGMATNLDPVLLCGSTETKKDAWRHPLMRLPEGVTFPCIMQCFMKSNPFYVIHRHRFPELLEEWANYQSGS